MKNNYVYGYLGCLPLKATFYPSAKGASDHPTIIYFHGGGLVYGKRDDLPNVFIQMFTQNGFSILSLDYPFIPECHLDTIISCLSQGLDWFSVNFKNLGLSHNKKIYFGRSAGAYLALLLIKISKKYSPEKLILFYGFYDLNSEFLLAPNTYYQKFPKVTCQSLTQYIHESPICSADIQSRFPIYVHFRQKGTWVKEMLGGLSMNDFSLSDNELNTLPSTFLAASTMDKDISIAVTEHMGSSIPGSKFFKVYGQPHDFDTADIDGFGKKAYETLIFWLS